MEIYQGIKGKKNAKKYKYRININGVFIFKIDLK
jgi:hypothetical protein